MIQNPKVWLISGASRGIGLAIAKAAAEAGDWVGAGVRSEKDAEHIKALGMENLFPVQLDVNLPQQVQAAVDLLNERFGKINVLVNNAGYGLQGMIEEVTEAQIREQMETNFFGLVSLTKAVIPIMRKAGEGYIINISSIAGLRGSPGLGIYNASKFAVEGFSEALALELMPFGIKVSVVEPGPYRTDWSGKSLVRSSAMKNAENNSPYLEKNVQIKSFFDERSGKQPGDPQQIASVLIQASKLEKPPFRMIFGDVAIKIWESHLQNFSDPNFITTFTHQDWSI